MSQLQAQQKTVSANGVNRRGDQDLGYCLDNIRKEHNRSTRSGSGNQSRIDGHRHGNHASFNNAVNQAGSLYKDKPEITTTIENRGGSQGYWNQNLLQLTACLVGQPVEVQVKCGSIYSGVFHTANAERNHGIVLRMVRLIKDGSSKGKADSGKEVAVRPYKEYVIFAKDIVQIIAKDVPLRGETLQNGRLRENRLEIMTDSLLSQGRQGDIERELKPWTSDANDSRDLELESTFEHTWNRNWDQFEINRTLFGVESTFNEELYTTKLERGPQMRDREREASRIAREIEEESSKNSHSVEEKNGRLAKKFEPEDEESRFSSVLRPSEVAGEEMEDLNTKSHISGGFGSLQIQPPPPVPVTDGLKDEADVEKVPVISNKKETAFASVATSVAVCESKDKVCRDKSSQVAIGDRTKHGIRVAVFSSPRSSSLLGDTASLQALNLDPGSPHVTEDVYREFNQFKQQENAKRTKQHREEQFNEFKSFSRSLNFGVVRQQGHTMPGNAHKTAIACAPPASALPLPTSITNPTVTPSSAESSASQSHPLSLKGVESLRDEGRVLVCPELSVQPSANVTLSPPPELPVASLNSTPSTTVPSSPSSEISSSGSSTKKSSLNAQAKDFKLNPNAKSFTPNSNPLKPPSPMFQVSSHVPGMVPQTTLAQNIPMAAPGNPQTPQVGQPPVKYSSPYNNAVVSGTSGGTPFLPPPPPPPFIGGQAPMKVPQLQQPTIANSYGPPQPVRYPSQAPIMQSTSTYMNPGGHLYSQQMFYSQPGQYVYYHPYAQGLPMLPPQPTTSSSQVPANQRGMGEMQMCIPPPYMAGQQHFLQPPQMPQLPNTGQPSSGSNSLPAMQPIQGVIGAGGMMPSTLPSPGATISNSSMMRVGGITSAAST